MTEENQKKIVLNVGCGEYKPEKLHAFFRNDNWREVRLDIDPAVKPDIIANIIDMQPVQSESIDAVWSSHNLEHLYFHQVFLALKEFWRILKKGGFTLITLPDLQVVAEYIAKGQLEEPMYVSPAGPVSPIDTVYGFRPSITAGNIFMAHKTGFTAHTLTQKLTQVGFQKVQAQRKGLDLWAVGHKI